MEEKRQNCQTCNGNCSECTPEGVPTVLSKKQSFVILLIIAIIGTLIGYVQSLNKADDNSQSKLITRNDEKSLYQQFFIMGTIFDCEFFDADMTKREKARDAALAELKRIEKLCNLFDHNSELYKLNNQAHVKPFKCSDELWEILQKARWAYEVSDGNFDITAEPLMKLWGFYRKQDKIPSDAEIQEALKFVGLNKVIFNDTEKTVFFPQKGFAFDLGGIAKGIAVDYALKAVNSFDLDRVLINLGGNISCYGKNESFNSFVIGIKHPINLNETTKTITLVNESVATSGNYERFVTIGGKKFAHIMNVKTGRPVENVLSVTIVDKSAGNADIFSTTVFIGGEETAKKLVEQFPNLRIYIFTLNNNVIDYKEFNNEILTDSEVQK